jgi:hypothetical protein
MYKFFAIPTPPEICKIPLEEEDESVVPLNVTVELAAIVLAGEVLPILPGLLKVNPLTLDEFKFATTVEEVTLIEVKAPLPGVPVPMLPGLAKVNPLILDAFKFATFVVLAIVNGAVPVASVLVIIPETLTVENETALGRSLFTRLLKVGVPLDPLGDANTKFVACEAKLAVIFPVLPELLKITESPVKVVWIVKALYQLLASVPLNEVQVTVILVPEATA